MPEISTDQQQKSEWFVLGAGALGCLWGAMLAQSGSKVTLIMRNAGIVRNAGQSHRQLTRLHYSKLQNTRSEPERSSVAATPDGECADTAKQMYGLASAAYEVEQATLIALAKDGARIANLLVTTKSYDALAAVSAALPLLGPDAKVVILCNGYGLHQPIAKLLNSSQRDIELYAGVMTDGALLRKPLDVVHTGMGTTKIGRFDGQTAAHFLPAKLPLAVQYVNDIESSILQKFFINCAINPLTALYQCTNGKLVSDPALHLLFQQLCRELQNIYLAVVQSSRKGKPTIGFAGFDVLQQASQVAAATAANQSSMLQDVRKNRMLELQYLNEEAIAQARRYGIACPINQDLVAQLQLKKR